MTSAQPRIQGLRRRGSGWSEMLTQTAPVAAAIAASKPSAQPGQQPGQADARGHGQAILDMDAEHGKRGGAGDIRHCHGRTAVYRGFATP